jgi:transposase-like protein
MSGEWKECKKCQSTDIVKNGLQDGVQRYKCKVCSGVFRGKAAKYSAEFKLDTVMMYINSMGIRAIARVKKIHNSVVSLWIKKMGAVVKDAFIQKIEEVQEKDINIVELDELFTYIKKKKIKRMYLVLLTEIGSELLISK